MTLVFYEFLELSSCLFIIFSGIVEVNKSLRMGKSFEVCKSPKKVQAIVSELSHQVWYAYIW